MWTFCSNRAGGFRMHDLNCFFRIKVKGLAGSGT
jgi:hypothetical protein